jgi:hypothetical protein
MASQIDAERVADWIDGELVGEVERVPDEAAEFNFTVDVSNILVHVVRRDPAGPLVVGQQIEYDEDIRARIQRLSDAERNELVARIRETLTAVPVIYGFHDAQGTNVRFGEVQRVLVEHRIYPDAFGQDALMTGLIDVWKALRYLDDLPGLIDAVQR